jgi:hypothetical protein
LRKVTFKEINPADLNNGICAIRLVRFAGEKPLLDAMYNDTSEVGCNGSVEKLLPELSNGVVASRCAELGEVMYSLRLDALWTDISRSAASASRTPTGNQP